MCGGVRRCGVPYSYEASATRKFALLMYMSEFRINPITLTLTLTHKKIPEGRGGWGRRDPMRETHEAKDTMDIVPVTA